MPTPSQIVDNQTRQGVEETLGQTPIDTPLTGRIYIVRNTDGGLLNIGRNIADDAPDNATDEELTDYYVRNFGMNVPTMYKFID